jgi:hypothetical protein
MNKRSCLLMLTILSNLPRLQAVEQKNPDYLALVKAYADAMVTQGRDTYGTKHSPLFATALDRKTMTIGDFPKITGVRQGDRSLRGANPQEEYGLYTILYELTAMTGDKQYTKAADAALGFFFNHCQSPQTGLMTWGEHLYWDFTKEAPGRDNGPHEICGEWPFWDQCYRLAPKACWRFAIGQWDHQIADKQSGDFARHARWASHGPGRGTDFPRYAGQMIACWADAHARPENTSRTRKAELIEAITVVVGRMEANMRASKTGYLLAGTDQTHRQIVWPKSNLELARCLWKAAPHMDAELAQRMKTLALQQDSHFHRLNHQITTNGGFIATLDSTTGKPRSRSMNRPYTEVWATGYGYGIHAGIANRCMTRMQQLKNDHPEIAAKYQPQILAAANQYLTTTPDTTKLLKPAAFASVITLMLNAHQLTGQNAYLQRANTFARLGVTLFLGDGLPLPKATNQHGHYETITGGPEFMLTLLRLHESLPSAPYPQSTLIRGIHLDWSSHQRGAMGSDNFQLTWAPDNHQYGAWGDGKGFSGSRVALGVARISGDGPNWKGQDIWYGDKDNQKNAAFSGKSWGMISVDGVLYMWFVPDIPLGKKARDHYAYIELLRSQDLGRSWQKADWRFLREESLSIPTFLNFGKDNAQARDDYIYSYFIDPLGHTQPSDNLIVHRPGKIYLARVRKDKLWSSKKAYQWYTGPAGGSDRATWGTLAKKQPVFQDPQGVGWCMSTTTLRGLKRTLLCTEHTQSQSGVMGIFEAPNPWGPWRTVKYWSPANPFGKGRPGDTLPWAKNVFFLAFSPKWQSRDGKTFTLTFTGGGRGKNNDSFNTVSGTFDVIEPKAQTWQVHSIDQEKRGADGVRLQDVNRDGRLDIACAWEEAGETRIYLHPGWDKVTQPWPKIRVGKSGKGEDAVFCDLDADGAVDVISASETKELFIHWAPKDPQHYQDEAAWQTEALPCARGVHNWMFTVPLQIDGQHGVDLLAAGKSDRVVWFEAPEKPRELSKWRMHVISRAGGWTMGLLAVDMDRDSDCDALLGIRNQNSGVKWLENPGPGSQQSQAWTVHEVGPQGMAMGFVEVCDLDKDGTLDVIAPVMDKTSVMIYRGLNRQATQWQSIEITVPKERNKGIAVGDINLDGQQDLVISHEYGDAAWLSHNGDIGADHWTYHHVASGGKLDDIELYDIDNDGDLDMLTTDERGLQVLWYENPIRTTED